MGLAINIGYLADLEQNDAEGAAEFKRDLKRLNKVLVKHNLQAHQEPQLSKPIPMRSAIMSFPYSTIHYLRRVYAHVYYQREYEDAEWIAEPLEDREDPDKDDVLDDVYDYLLGINHLLNHSVTEGYYVPQDFEEVIFDDSVRGVMIGSSQQLLKELIEVAPALKIKLKKNKLSDDEASRVLELSKSGGLFREYTAWLALFLAAQASIEHKTLIVFS
jgi:hypothetical protein